MRSVPFPMNHGECLWEYGLLTSSCGYCCRHLWLFRATTVQVREGSYQSITSTHNSSGVVFQFAAQKLVI